MTQHVGCTPHCHYPPGLLFPFYQLSSHSFNPPNSLSLSWFFNVVAGAGNMGAAAERWWWGSAWGCWHRQACPGLARVLDGSSRWPCGGGGGVRKEVDIDVLATWCRSLKWLCNNFDGALHRWTMRILRHGVWKTVHFTYFSMDFCESIAQFVENVVNNNSIEIIVESNPE